MDLKRPEVAACNKDDNISDVGLTYMIIILIHYRVLYRRYRYYNLLGQSIWFADYMNVWKQVILSYLYKYMVLRNYAMFWDSKSAKVAKRLGLRPSPLFNLCWPYNKILAPPVETTSTSRT